MVLGAKDQESKEMNGAMSEVLERSVGSSEGPRTLLDETIEALIHWTEKAFGGDEIVRAKEDFFARIGKVFPDDIHYMPFMTFFLDYLLFERPASPEFLDSLRVHFPEVATLELTPFYLAMKGRPWPSASLKAPPVLELRGFRHSIYEVVSVEKTHATFKDLLTNEKIEVHARAGESFGWIARKDCFQTHLYEWGDKLHLSEGIIGHPPAVRRIILKRIKVFKKDGRRSPGDFLLRLAFAKLKHLRLKTMNIAKVYSEI